MIRNVLLTVYLVVHVYICKSVVALECFTCRNVNDPRICNSTTICNTDEQCHFGSVGSGTLVGRDITIRQDNRCHECCSTDLCNDILCSRRKPAECIDDETVDCPRLESLFGVCKDINHSKHVCPKFCGLCDVVDGGWTAWAPWSACDVTCENGTNSRVRTCTNPAPSHGGLKCEGDKSETKSCHIQLCPVHGGWSKWEPWGVCSATCDVGIQSRQRTCTNPVPQRNGNHCFGVNLDARICLPKACADGQWTDWGIWDSCSVSCGGGFQSRSRNCTSPAPSLSGRQCIGDSLQVQSCSDRDCQDTVVSFEATLSHSTNCSTGQYVIFDRIKINQGSAFNSSTGIFTAQENGTYHISLTLMSSANSNGFSVGIKKNSQSYIGYLYLQADPRWEHRSSSVIIYLNRGDSLSIECLEPSSFYGSGGNDAHDFNCHFSGFRIGP